MSKFFGKVKQAFTSKKPPKYKSYESQEIRMIGLKTRVILSDTMEQLFKVISIQDQKFKYVGNNPQQTYSVLQSIGEKVVEAESMKILIEMMRKVEANAVNIANTNGDISLLKAELPWFQCVLWYRKSREVKNLEDIYNFCQDFFKGVDVTKDMNIHCEVFSIFPILKYLKKNEALPLAQVLFYLQPYVSCNIPKPTLDTIFELNKNDLLSQTENNKTKSIINQGEYNPYEIKPPNPNSSTININPNPNFSSINPNPNPYPNKQNISMGISNIPNPNLNPNYQQAYKQSINYTGNTYNLPSSEIANQNNPFVINDFNSFAPQDSHYYPPQNNNINHNPFNSTPFSNNSQIPFQPQTQPQQHNNHINPQKPFPKQQPHSPIEEKPSPKPAITTKQSFFNSLIRASSNNPNKNTLNTDIDRQREANDYLFNQSQVPFKKEEENHNYEDLNEQKRKREEEWALLQKMRLEEEKRRKQYQLIEVQRKEKQREEREREEKQKRQREQEEREAQREREQIQHDRQRQARLRERDREEQIELNVFVDNQREQVDRGYSGRFSSNMGFKFDVEEQAQQFSYSNTDNLNSSLLKLKTQQEKVAVGVIDLEGTDQQESIAIIEKFGSESCSKTFMLFYDKKAN